MGPLGRQGPVAQDYGNRFRSKSSRSASDSQSVAATPSHKAGSVPQYLLNRQEKWRQAEERRAKNKPDPRYAG